MGSPAHPKKKKKINIRTYEYIVEYLYIIFIIILFINI